MPRPSRSRSRSRSPKRRSARDQRKSSDSRSRSRSRSPRNEKRRGGRRRSRSSSRSSTSMSDRRENPPPSRIIGIFGLSYSTDERKLDYEFSRYGQIDKIQLVRDPEGRSRGFGFINYYRVEDAREAKYAMCDRFLDGKRIRVDYSISDGPHSKTPGRYLGKYGKHDRFDHGYDDYHHQHHYRGRSPYSDSRSRRRSYSPRR